MQLKLQNMPSGKAIENGPEDGVPLASLGEFMAEVFAYTNEQPEKPRKRRKPQIKA